MHGPYLSAVEMQHYKVLYKLTLLQLLYFTSRQTSTERIMKVTEGRHLKSQTVQVCNFARLAVISVSVVCVVQLC